jgi:hypothetical protein
MVSHGIIAVYPTERVHLKMQLALTKPGGQDPSLPSGDEFVEFERFRRADLGI